MSRHLQIDPGRLGKGFGTEAFAVTHTLVEHPLLQFEALAQLAGFLPEGDVEHNLADVPTMLPGGRAPRLDLSPEEIVRTIDTNGCWMVLKRIEQHAGYRRLLEESLADVIATVGPREGGIRRLEAFVFLSAANSTTPAHFDPEHNFLLQIAGTKSMTVGQFPSRQVEISDLERYHSGGHRNVAWLPARPRTFEMAPGSGVYVPVHAPHLVKNGPVPSISLSVTFFTAEVYRIGHVHAFNAKLRKMRLSPRPPNERRRLDRVKETVWVGVGRSVRLARRLTDRRNAAAR